jgi:hypothetical protein
MNRLTTIGVLPRPQWYHPALTDAAILLGAVVGACLGSILMQGRGASSYRRRRRRALSRGAPFNPIVDLSPPVQWAIVGGVVGAVTAPPTPSAG